MPCLTGLFAVQRLLGLAQRHPLHRALFDRAPVLLMVGGELRAAQPRRARVTEDELRQRPRLAGISRLEEVGCVVLERNGQISVPRRDADLDPWPLDDVPGAAGIGK
ncbi:MAG TPA: YetF domain-containing protein [Pseudonocardia sp.]|nr:YetF domain-containing protein [Pseudonocardia sp.]